PDDPDLFSGTYSEKWFNTNLCGADDKIRIRYQTVAQDVNNPVNIGYQIGIRPESENDPVSTALDFGTGMGLFDFRDSSGEDRATLGLTVRGLDVLAAFLDVENSTSRLTINDPNENVVMVFDENSATLNDFDICLKEYGSTTEGEYTIERSPNGSILQIYQKVYVQNPTVNPNFSITVSLPLALPSADDANVSIQLTGIATGGFVVGSYRSGTLTTTSLDISLTDGVNFSDADSYVEITWNP
ncbi:unnamed protein product, partial [marine sediment metagenome]